MGFVNRSRSMSDSCHRMFVQFVTHLYSRGNVYVTLFVCCVYSPLVFSLKSSSWDHADRMSS